MRIQLALSWTCLAGLAACGASPARRESITNAPSVPPVANVSSTVAAESVAASLVTADAPRPNVAPQSPSAPAATPSAPRARDLVLPPDWSSMPRAAFARALDAWTHDVELLRLDDATITILARALAGEDETAVRAAVVLGRSRDPRAGEALLVRLEQRVGEGTRSLAGDIVAADAFRAGATARDAATRLEALSRGATAHPVLDVRVACAASSVALGRDGAIPFLLAIAREGTSSASTKPDWRRLDWNERRMQLLMDRAAAALSARVDIECAYRAEAPLATREAEIVRLARLLSSANGSK